jgi:hypothetical protein
LVLLQQQRFEEAISALRTAVKKEPGNVFSVAARFTASAMQVVRKKRSDI